MGRRLYVGNLPYSATEDQLTELFGRAGKVDNVRVMRDMATGRARGFAFVEIVNDEDAAKATSFETERAFQLAKAARAYEAGGNATKAKEIWTSLMNDPKGQTMSAEARVRLGELNAAPAKR